MNELLQQRIESVQAGRNTTHAQLEAKRSLREQLDSDLEAFLKNGGAVEQLPQGFSGECSKGWSGSKPKSQKTMREVMANSVAQTDKKRARQKEDQATLAEIKVLDRWCKERKGRGGELCKHIGVAHGGKLISGEMTRPHLDTIENMNPACVPCNSNKSSMSLKSWRSLLTHYRDVQLLRDSTHARHLHRFGLIEIKSEPVVFFFEKYGVSV